MLKFIKNLFFGNNDKTLEPIEKCNTVVRYKREELFGMLTLSDYGNVEYANGYDSNKETLLIMDDIIDTYTMYEIDFDKIKILNNEDVFKRFNVLKAIGVEAGFLAYKAIVENIKIDYAILDITVGNMVKFDNGEYLEIDGVDIGLMLLKKDAKIIFSTVHTMNKKMMVMEYYINKFEDCGKNDIANYTMTKNSERIGPLFNFLYGDTDVE